jgi:alkylation response protein AidB-like acyl-CoA dehydrogenase
MIEDLSETEQQRAFAEAASRSFAACAGLSAADILRRLVGDGFPGLLAPEDHGGLGLGLRAALPVARAAGRQLLAFPLVEAMLATGFAARHASALASRMLAGEGFATVAWSGRVHVAGDRAQGVAALAPCAGAARWLVLRALRDGCETAALIDLDQAGIEIVPSDALDSDRPIGDVVLRDVPVIAIAETEWRPLADAGAVLRAADMIGAAEASFADACAHVSTRRQFGKPLSALQVVATTLARDHFALTGAALSVEYAALAADEAFEDADIARDVACSVAQDAAVTAAENAIQLHGALGFTAPMPLHRRLRRIQSAADIYGAKAARASLAEALLDSWKEAA